MVLSRVTFFVSNGNNIVACNFARFAAKGTLSNDDDDAKDDA